MGKSLTRNYMMDRMARLGTPFNAAKKGAHFFALHEGVDELIVVNVDHENGLLTYNYVDNPAEDNEIMHREFFNTYFEGWKGSAQAQRGKREKYRQEIIRAWDAAHEEHQDFLIREAATAGDAQAVMTLVEQIRTQAKNKIRQVQDSYENASSGCGDPHCEVCF